MRLILVRHGQTPANVGGLLDTAEPGCDLTDLGREQALALPAVLADQPVEAVYASVLVRTQQTAGPLAQLRGLDIHVRRGIREIQAGDLEMLGDDASVRTYLETTFAWSAGRLDARIPGGENGHEVYARYDDVVAEAAAAVRCAVLVSHGSVIRSWTAAHATNITTAFASQRPLANTGVVVLEGSPAEGWTATSWEGRTVEVAGAPDARAGDGPGGEPVDEVAQGR
jgi:broad specificity phosphatase PhoE